jgi:hypothetical protein
MMLRAMQLLLMAAASAVVFCGGVAVATTPQQCTGAPGARADSVACGGVRAVHASDTAAGDEERGWEGESLRRDGEVVVGGGRLVWCCACEEGRVTGPGECMRGGEASGWACICAYVRQC